MAVDVYSMLVQFVQNLLTDRDAAVQYVQDPYGTLAVQGITDNDLSGCNMQQVVGEALGSPGVPEATRSALQPYSGGGSAPAHHHPVQPPPAQGHHAPVENVVQHLNYVTYVTYEGDENITQQLINIDNSTNIDNSVNVDIDVDGNLHGGIDIDIDTTNVNATGDGAVANAGDGDVNAATGDGAQIIDGDNHGQANTGDGSVQVGGSTDGTVINFGAGDVTNVNDTHVQDGAIAVGGDATNVSGNTLGDGSAIALGGDASGHNEETTTTTVITDIDTTTNTNIDQDYSHHDNDTVFAPNVTPVRQAELDEPVEM
ncbi:MAG TPA: hypothetical protein VFX60_08235 [Micromonospora sp.]|nr:hypothetical protein [Micromonospora sp.]